MRGLFLIKICSIKLASCIFAVLIFSRFAQLGDSETYINATVDISFAGLINRTSLTENFFAVLALIFGRGILLHLITAIIVSLTIYYVYRKYSQFLSNVFWLLLLMPLFAVWTSVVGKESLAFCAFLLISKWIAEVVVYGRSNNIVLMIAILAGGVLRPHYLLAYLFLLILVYLFQYKRDFRLVLGIRFSSGVYFVSMVVFSLFVIGCVHFFQTYWQPHLYGVMKTAESYFLSYEGNTNRDWIDWETYGDFVSNMWWGIPASLLGPTLSEVRNNILFIPFFLEGIFSICLIFYFMYMLAKYAAYNIRIRFFLYVAFIPAVIIALVIHYPFGIFNPGSATRYKQSLAPLFYFLPILVIAANRKKFQVVSD